MIHPSQKQFTLRNGKIFGAGKLLVCVPLISKSLDALLEDARQSAAEHPDVIEWRVDHFDQFNDSEYTAQAAVQLREVLGDIPVLFTPRQPVEGGAQELDEEKKLALIEAVCKTGAIDLLDVELCCDEKFIANVRQITSDNGVKLVLSYHDFRGMPSLDDAKEKLLKMELLGADVNKLALMPKDYHDVAEFSQFICEAKKAWMNNAAIISLMGEVGGVTRFAGASLGTDLSFVSVTGISGPGQMHITDYRILNHLIED